MLIILNFMEPDKFRTIALLIVGILLTGFAKAQVSTNASGGNAEGIGGTINYSIGQMTYSTYSGISGNIAQGVQHAYEIFPIKPEQTYSKISVSIFPNPTEDYLTLDVSDFKNEKLLYQLYDMEGRLLQYGVIISNQTILEMKSLAAAVYIVKVYATGENGRYEINDSKENIKVFKIIKK